MSNKKSETEIINFTKKSYTFSLTYVNWNFTSAFCLPTWCAHSHNSWAGNYCIRNNYWFSKLDTIIQNNWIEKVYFSMYAERNMCCVTNVLRIIITCKMHLWLLTKTPVCLRKNSNGHEICDIIVLTPCASITCFVRCRLSCIVKRQLAALNVLKEWNRRNSENG